MFGVRLLTCVLTALIGFVSVNEKPVPVPPTKYPTSVTRFHRREPIGVRPIILTKASRFPQNQTGILAPTPPKPAPVPPSSAPWPTASIGVLGPCVGISAVQAVIACAAEWAGIDGGAFLAIAERESSLIPTAVSYTGCCKGLFQLHESYFASWAQRYTDLRWFGGIVPSYFDPRANALVAAGLWRSQGGPCPAWC